MILFDAADVALIRAALKTPHRKRVGVLDRDHPESMGDAAYIGGRSSPIYTMATATPPKPFQSKRHLVFAYTHQGRRRPFLVEIQKETVTVLDPERKITAVSYSELRNLGLMAVDHAVAQSQDLGLSLTSVVLDPTFGWYRKLGLSDLLFASPTPNAACTKERVLTGGARVHIPDFTEPLLEETGDSSEPKRLPKGRDAA